MASSPQLPSASSGAAPDAANRISQFGPVSYTFDNQGMTTSKTDAQGTTGYQWAARGRLTQASLPSGQTVSYGYDALGRRASRTAGGVTTNFLYDGADVVLDQASDGSHVDYLNGGGIDQKLRQTSSLTGTLYFLEDHLGSTASLTDAAGSVIEREQYEAFGQSIGSSLTRYGYTGRERDNDRGPIY